MAAHASSRQHILRDLRQTYFVVGCAVVAVTFLVVFFNRWSPVSPHHEQVTKQQASGLSRQLEGLNIDSRYAGWIISNAPNELKCSKRLFDNRTGYLWDQGYVKCQDAVDPQEDGSRFHNIGKAFRHE